MPATYTITLTDEEERLFRLYNDPQHWIETVFYHRANEAMKELYKLEIDKAKAGGASIPASVEDGVIASDEESMAARTQAMEDKLNVPEGIDPLTGEPFRT